ncbi:amino acid transporter AVT1B [Selaginella moellendorffii]|nr:amino acid transporter AVT1B [Selaginella moellendorffii]|eukprot:XP_002993770.2 amino acid transporter AVT1B [Selaginella moellendorffii]
MESERASPPEARFYLDFDADEEDEQQQQRKVSSGDGIHHKIEEEDGEDEEEEEEDDALATPRWPQSYRKSMDIYSHMPSPSLNFLTSPNVSRSSLLSTSLGKHYESATSILDPLLTDQEFDKDEKRLTPSMPPPPPPQSHIVTVSSETRLRKTSSTRISPSSDAQDYHHLQLPKQGCTFFQATLNGINVLAGVGVLSTPYALKQGGWIGAIILLLFAVVCCYTGILLRKCLESEPGLVTYPDIGQAAFGRIGRLVISIILYVELYACCVEFLILEGDNLASLFPNARFSYNGHKMESQKVFSMIAALFILPTVWLRDLSLLSYISAGGVVTSIIVVVSVWWVGAVDGVGFRNTGSFINFGNLPVSIGLIGFCFSGHAVFPNIYSSMKDRAQFNRVLQLCFLLCILMYGGVAIMGFKMFGAETQSQVTLNLPKQFVASKIALWTTVITPLTKYALTITPVALSLEELLPTQVSKNHFASVLIRTSLVTSTLFVALMIPFFGFVMAFIGSFLSLTGSLILPSACYLSISGRRIPKTQAIICVMTIFIGVIAAIAGTYSSVTGIITQYRSS